MSDSIECQACIECYQESLGSIGMVITPDPGLRAVGLKNFQKRISAAIMREISRGDTSLRDTTRHDAGIAVASYEGNEYQVKFWLEKEPEVYDEPGIAPWGGVYSLRVTEPEVVLAAPDPA